MGNNQLLKPLITEKTMRLAQAGQFTFYVPQSATKPSIKQAVESLFPVNVINLQTGQIRGKTKRTGKKRLVSTTPDQKKAIITLKPGQTIDYFQSPEDKKSKSKETKKSPSQPSTPAPKAQSKKRGFFGLGKRKEVRTQDKG